MNSEYTYLVELRRAIRNMKKHKDHKLACVSYGYIKCCLFHLNNCQIKINNQKFFSFNSYRKIINEDEIVSLIKDILEDNPLYIDYNCSSNLVKDRKNIFYSNPKSYYDFFEKLDKMHCSTISYSLLEKPESFDTIYNDYARYFSCAEKKIGLIQNLSNIYITMVPCYLCLPYIKCKCTYLDVNDKLKHLNYINEFKTKNPITNETYTNIIFSS